MVSEKVIVVNPNGIHMKPAGYLCNLALEFQARVLLRIDEKEVNANSILGILSACIKAEDEVEIICNGADEKSALNAIIKGFKEGLGEDLSDLTS